MSTPSEISNRELSFRTFGNDGSGDGRRKAIRERAQDSRSAVAAKRLQDARIKPDKVAHFLTETYLRLQGIAARQIRANHPSAKRANAILFNTVRSKLSGFVAIAPKAESAAFLADWLRSWGVDEFCSALADLDRIAGTQPPAGQPVAVTVADLVRSLSALEFSGIAEAEAAAKHLRTASIVGTHARVYVTPEVAGDIAEWLYHAAGPRDLVSSLDRIAGRTEPRTL